MRHSLPAETFKKVILIISTIVLQLADQNPLLLPLWSKSTMQNLFCLINYTALVYS